MTTTRSIYWTCPPAVAGAFHPSGPEGLGRAVTGRLDAARGALIEARWRGLAVERLALTNSGDTNGGRDGVVGYGACVLVEGGRE